MPSKATLLTIDEPTTKKLEAIGKQRGLPFATVCRSLIIEKLNEMSPEDIAVESNLLGNNRRPVKGVSAHV